MNQYIPDLAKKSIITVAYGLYRMSEHLSSGPFRKYDFQTFTVIRECLRESSNCIEVGANVGQILREVVRAAPKGQRIAFEPIPGLFAQSEKRCGANV